MWLKFIFSKKATKFDEIFTIDLTLYSKCQIDGEDFVNFCGFLENMNFTYVAMVSFVINFIANITLDLIMHVFTNYFTLLAFTLKIKVENAKNVSCIMLIQWNVT